MSTHATREEFEERMQVLEGEVEGEKLVTRYILAQSQRKRGCVRKWAGCAGTTMQADIPAIRAALAPHDPLGGD